MPVLPGPRLLPCVGPGARTQEATAAAGRSPLVVTREPVTASGAAPPLGPAGSHGWEPTVRLVPRASARARAGRPGSPESEDNRDGDAELLGAGVHRDRG